MDESWIYSCCLCPRACHADRTKGQGYCRTRIIKNEKGEWTFPVARAALHYGEEPCISGSAGSGAVFFAGCSLRCVFCQNSEISGGNAGKYITVCRLCEIFLELEEKGANNINLVTAGHLAPFAAQAVDMARACGMSLPVVYNSGGYETEETLKMLCGRVDIYMPDLKYDSCLLAQRLSGANDYPQTARAAISEMFSQTGPAVLDENGLMKKGVLVRHLVLPGTSMDSQRVIGYLYETYGNDIYISIMGQYTPVENVKNHRLLGRRLFGWEYERIASYAAGLGIENGYVQEPDSAGRESIPRFDNTGV